MTPSRARRPVAEEKAISQAVQAIEQAKRPLLMIGAGANRKVTARMLRQFVDRLGIPFFTTQMGKGVIDESHRCCVGNAALSDSDFVHRAIDRADLIINVGHDVVEKPPFFMRKGRRRVIHINFSGAEVDAVYFPQLEVIGDIGNAIWQLNERLAPQAHWDFDFAARVRSALEEDLASHEHRDGFPMHPRRIVHEVRQAMPNDGIVSLDNGLYKVWFARNYRARQPNTVLLDNALATMGAGLPVAMGARLVHPDRKILAVCGDGGFMMNSQELETAVRLEMDLVILVLRDDAYGMIRWKQQDMGLPDFGLSFGNPDLVRYAESYGAQGHRVESADQLGSILSDCLAKSGVHLIDCPVDYSDSQRQLFDDIPQRSRALTLTSSDS
jgi:acetolactate synthase-1/2/3 large subunit